jgi:hypothetical protein
MVHKKDEHVGIDISASKGGLKFLRWLIPLLISCGLIGGGVRADMVNSDRITSIEEIVNNNTLEINGQSIKLDNYIAQLVEMKEDLKETRATSERILLVLTRK